jgi:hypothetical protein
LVNSSISYKSALNKRGRDNQTKGKAINKKNSLKRQIEKYKKNKSLTIKYAEQ